MDLFIKGTEDVSSSLSLPALYSHHHVAAAVIAFFKGHILSEVIALLRIGTS